MWRPTSRSNGELKRGAVVASSEVKIEDRMAQVSTAVVSVQVALRVMRAAGVLTGPEGAEEMPLAEPQVHAHIDAVSGGKEKPRSHSERVITSRLLGGWKRPLAIYCITLQDA